MDLWVVAAATGAGYLAKHLHNSAEEKEELSESGSSRKNKSKFGDIFLKSDEYVTNENDEIADIFTLTKFQKSEIRDVWENGNRPLIRSKRAHGLSIIEKRVKKCSFFSPPPSPCTPFASPLIVNRFANREDTSDYFGDFVDGGDNFSLEAKNEFSGSRQSGLFELPRTRKGLPNGIILFFAGITIGIISSIIANERELDDKNTQLKQKESLVRDLHEEIEMRDRFSVKEISSEDKKSSNEELDFLSSKHDLEKSTVDNPEVRSKIEMRDRLPVKEITVEDKKSSSEELVFSSSKHDLEKSTVDNPTEVRSKIEAELEAELEKLELKIASAELEEIYDYVELDPDFEADVVQGDLKVHVAQPADTNQSEFANNNASGTHHSSNYAVSPWELTLRMHKLIESRLEARIQKLELALETSKKRLSLNRVSVNSEFGFSETRIYTYQVDDTDPPLDMSL